MINRESFVHDRANMFDLLVRLPRQIEEAILLQPELPLPDISGSLQQVVITGMGGSAVGGDLLAGLYGDQLDLPLIVNRDYRLPQFVGAHSLVIACSYSGDTEETLASFEQAESAGAPIVCISSGGKLAKLAALNEHGYIRLPQGLPPRCALGYLFFSLMKVMQEYGLIVLDADDVHETLTTLEELVSLYRDFENPANPAVALASALAGKIPVIYCGDEPNPALHRRWRNQINENSKMPAFSNLLPEMNHNEIAAWHPAAGNLAAFHVLLLCDDHNPTTLRQRMEVTRDIIDELHVPVTQVHAVGKSRLCRTFSLLLLADFVSFYLALLNGVDPTDIRNIDQLKSQLAKVQKKK